VQLLLYVQLLDKLHNTAGLRGQQKGWCGLLRLSGLLSFCYQSSLLKLRPCRAS
jgi:hypothetical protein